MSVKDAFGSAWNFVATADRLLKLETKTNETMAGIQAQVTALDKRLNDLEHRVDRLADECWGGRPRGISCQGLAVNIRT